MMGAMGILCLLLIGIGVSAEQSGDMEPVQSDSSTELLELPETLAERETPPPPFTIEEVSAESSVINGTGNLSRLIEMNTSTGDYVFNLLQITGTENTYWEYMDYVQNSSGWSYAGGMLVVKNAEKILFEGHSITPDERVAYAGVGLVDHEWEQAGPYSGQLAVMTGVMDGSSVSIVESQDEVGTITHLTRAYHVIPCDNASSVSHGVPGLEWNPDEDKTGISSHERFCYDKYAGSFSHYITGSTDGSYAYAVCTPYQAYSTQYQEVQKIGFLQSNTMVAEWPAKNIASQGSGILEELMVVNGTSVKHQGHASLIPDKMVARGMTQATADSSIHTRIMPEGDESEPSWRLGYADTEVTGGKHRRGVDGPVSIPASYDGWVEGLIDQGVYQTNERYGAKGAEVSRTTFGGVYVDRQNPVTGVTANITAGTDANTKGACGITGMAILKVDGRSDNATSLDGRWIVSSPQGIPVTRWIEAVRPGTSAYSTTSTSTGTKNVKESAYYRSGTVNVIP